MIWIISIIYSVHKEYFFQMNFHLSHQQTDMEMKFSELEKELQELSPAKPTTVLRQQISKALGPQGDLALRCLPEEEKLIPFRIVRKWAIVAGFIFLLSIFGASYYLLCS